MDKNLKKAGIEEKYFHTGEVIMNYVAGPPNGTPLIFIPGQTGTWEKYTLILPKLADRFQVFAVTLRGHGNSSWTPGRYTFDQLGKDMSVFLKEVLGKPAIVAGHSMGGVLTAWLAANSPEFVKAIILEDPPLFRCEWPAIKETLAFDMFLRLSRIAVAGGGGYAKFFLDGTAGMAEAAKGIMRMPPKAFVKLISLAMTVHQAFSPGNPMDIKVLPISIRMIIKGISQFDGNFARAFVEGTMGEGFDHAATLARITQPVLFLHANWFMRGGRLSGALDDNDVERVRSLVNGPWKYVHINCGHAIALEAPAEESKEILKWADEYV
ncbi:MAG: alpha/beta hydrolase [Treponema sp.]|jgi:pimeloyl-ACP methyl ester carboxylesterase|nr:alpha/beta hydrolase [Treponema sp.]